MLVDTSKQSIGRTRIETSAARDLYMSVAIVLVDRTVLSDETFRLVQMEGEEGISTPFEFQLTLHANSEVPGPNALTFTALLGCPVSVTIGAAGTALGVGPAPGLFNGMVASFAMSEPGVYKLTMRPALWKLSLANRYRLYSQQSIRGVIQQVCDFQGISVDFRNLDAGSAPNLATSRVQDWLQSGESDLDLVQRLMRQANLFYYFECQGTDHTVVFANDTQHPAIQPPEALRYTYTTADSLGLHQDDVIFQYSYEQTLCQNGVNGAFTFQEEASGYDTVATFSSAFRSAGDVSQEPCFSLHKVYEYPLDDQLANSLMSTASLSLQTQAVRFSGAGACPRLRAGYEFQTVGDVDNPSLPMPVRPTLDQQWFVAQSVKHRASLDGLYQNEFVAVPADGSLSQVTVQDSHQGTILATVAGYASGSETPSRWPYCAPSNFDPEPHSAQDSGNTTNLNGVYVTFATDPGAQLVWVKLASHMTGVPTIGSLVVVARSSDESELPEIQYILSSGGTLTVTPAKLTADTRVGSNYSTVYGDERSIRWGANSTADPTDAINTVQDKYGTSQFRDVSYSTGARYSYETSDRGDSGKLSESESHGSTFSKAQGHERHSHDIFAIEVNTADIGVANRNTAVALTDDNTTAGLSNQLNLTGVSSHISATGAAVEVNLYGTRLRVEKVGMELSLKQRDPVAASVEEGGIEMKILESSSTL